MARAIHSNSIGAGLDEVARYYQLGNKLPDALERSKGLRELPDDVMTALGQYCAVDTMLCRMVFDQMAPAYPPAEFDLIDLTLRMFCQPVLVVDMALAQQALDDEIREREAKIAATELDLKTLRGGDSFADALLDCGVTPPIKHSAKQQKDVWAFAKGDLEFMELAQHANPKVRALVEGRLAAKSTIGETRAKRFLDVGRDGATLPVLLNYCGAHTTRWSGGNKMNMQNLKRGGTLRKCVLAPPGYMVLACDSSQIEARVLAWLADHYAMLAAFQAWDEGTGPDVYKLTAVDCYKKAIEDITKDERFVGKVATLGLGFGMGADKYEYTLAAGVMGPAMFVPNEQCRTIVNAFRTKNEPYPKLWRVMELMLYRMLHKAASTYKVLEFTRDGSILLPNGLYLNYPGLAADYDHNKEAYTNYRYFNLDDQAKQRRGEHPKGNKIYGGLLTENVVQALARIIVADQMLVIAKELRVVTMTHDEVVCIVKESEVPQAEQFMLQTMRQAPSWCENLPLNAEAEYGVRYG